MNELYIKRLGKKKFQINEDYLYYHTSGSRYVYIGKKYVLKIAEGWDQCLDEFKNYLKVKNTEYEKYFCPILQYGEIEGCSYVVQPKLPLAPKRIMKNFVNEKDDIHRKTGCEDLHFGNWTVIDNQVVVFDYGYEVFTKI